MVLHHNFKHLLQMSEQVQVIRILFARREFNLPQNKSGTNVIASKIKELKPKNRSSSEMKVLKKRCV